MRRLAPLVAALVLTSGCFLVFDGGGEGGDGDITSDDDICPPSVPEPPARLELRNPDTLTCDVWIGGGSCDGRCGPCPFAALTSPPPPWGACNDACEALGETACAADARCRVVKDAACALSGTCVTDFLGCFPTNQSSISELACFTARTGWECADGAACVAYHRSASPSEPREFAMCAPEGKAPGRCFAQVTCASAAPTCPSGSRPGVAEGCYTGACIPADVCEPQP